MLPTAWFRNTWSWDERRAQAGYEARRRTARSTSSTPSSARSSCSRTRADDGTATNSVAPTPLFCENETNAPRLFGCPPATPYPKDGINDHVVGGAPTVNPEQQGTKCAFWYRLTVQPGATATIRLQAAAEAGNGNQRSVR